MPKNAVERLQKVDNDLKTVIHIYDIADKYKNENDKPEASKNEGAQQSSLHESSKKSLGFDIQYSQGVPFRKSWLMPKKPESAPSSSSALFTICESDHIGQPSSESINNPNPMDILKEKIFYENLNNLSNTSIQELLMTPSKTLQAAHEILAENKFTDDTEIEGDCELPFYESIPYVEKKNTEDASKLNDQYAENNVSDSHSLKQISEFNFIRLKEELDCENIIERSRSVPARKENLFQKKMQDWPSATFEKADLPANSKKNKSSLEISPKHNMISKKIPRLETPKSVVTEEKNSAKPRSEIKKSQEKTNKPCNGTAEKDDQLTKKINGGDTKGNKFLKEVKSKTFEKNGLKEKKAKSPPVPTDDDNQKKTCKTVMQEDMKLWVKELSKIIEISNEKLEKMKFSKELALDIANRLKNKYDEIQESKKKLIEKVENLERVNHKLQNCIFQKKENEKLHFEIKEAQQTKMKLQLKMEGIKKDSRTKLIEQNIKTKSALDENICLKTKMCDIERHYNEELLKKQKEIDQIQKERLNDIKNELKNRENREEEIQKLKNEKSELQSQLEERHSKMIILEEKIHQLQEEIQKHKEHLKKKTDRLAETNKELELIRQNSRDLEEQVKTLRKNIENFDEIQKNLMKQTAAYDEKIKLKQEKIKKLYDENSKLKIELENEKDAQLIKAKIIEDQQETIKNLREKSEENKTLVKKNQSLERILNIEREEKLELQEAVEHLKRRKEELKKKINSLESDHLMAPQEVIKNLKRTQIVLHELENQVQIKQKEWELQFQCVLKEKEQANSVAEFATKKLMQITNEFQRQTQAYKKLKIILAGNLAVEEKNRQETKENATLAQLKLSVLNTHLDDINSGCLKDRNQNNDDILMNWYLKNSSSYREDPEPKSNLHLC